MSALGPARVVKCADCPHGYHLDVVPPGRHAPHWVVRDGRRLLVNCAGKELIR